MRGKAVHHKHRHSPGRITPAHAGKRGIRYRMRFRTRDHPRLCGEKTIDREISSLTRGSPPRMRGKTLELFGGAVVDGITPAYARKSICLALPITAPMDHPRVCGEKTKPVPAGGILMGSPPRMRGKVDALSDIIQDYGITPACAGKSSIQHLTASLGEFKVQKGHPVPHLRQRLQVWPDHARHLRHGLILHASRSAGQGRRLCPGPCPDTAGSGTPRGPSPAKRPHTSPPAATPGGCRAWQSGATAPGSR